MTEQNCQIEMFDRQRCGREIYKSDLHPDAEPVCLMHSKDPKKSKAEFQRELSRCIAEAGTGTADFSRFVFPDFGCSIREIAAECLFPGATFLEKTDFGGTKFLRKVDFTGVRFLEIVSFSKCTFNEDATFDESEFAKSANFLASKFNKSAQFYQARFLDEASFAGTNFQANAQFSGVRIEHVADFGGAQFNDEVSFTGAKFGAKVDFVQVIFTRRVWFEAAEFTQKVDFTASKFSCQANFQGAKFLEKTDFFDVKFLDEGYFHQTVFNQQAYFAHASFQTSADFREAEFSHGALFNNASFQRIDCSLARIKHSASFAAATFAGKAYFSGTEFGESPNSSDSERVVFKDAVFLDEVDFGGTIFAQPVQFAATFKGPTHFTSARFKHNADFRNAQFKRFASFNLARFFDKADFFNAIFDHDVVFNWTTFDQYADFQRTRFMKSVEFRETSFRHDDTLIPGPVFSLAEFSRRTTISFYKTYLGQALFHNCDASKPVFSSVEWRLRKNSGKRMVFEEIVDLHDLDPDVASSLQPKQGSLDERDYALIAELYRQLKKNHDRRGDFWTAGDFHFGEMEMKRLASSGRSRLRRRLHQYFGLAAWYKYASEYGEDYRRPALILSLTIILFALLYPLVGLQFQAGPATSPVYSRVSYWHPSLADSKQPHSIWIDETKLIGNSLVTSLYVAAFQKDLTYQPSYPLGRILALLEVLITSTLLALFLLAVRRRFKR